MSTSTTISWRNGGGTAVGHRRHLPGHGDRAGWEQGTEHDFLVDDVRSFSRELRGAS
jgi:hypothetical protein